MEDDFIPAIIEHEEEIACGDEEELAIAEVDVGEAADEQSATSGETLIGNVTSSSNTTNKKLAIGMHCETMGTATNVTVKKSKKRRDSGTSSDEERWLTAIESGKLEDVDDELKKIKDPKLMTARQRAMYERTFDKEPFPGSEMLMSLPNGYREKEKPQTAEELQKAALKSQKRKQLADEKREKDKKKTMERLLKKQESKQRSAARNKGKAPQPIIRYINTLSGAYIVIPPEHEYPFAKQEPREPPSSVLVCGIDGCGRPKVYSCSKTNIPLCSFECYRKNMRQIMC